MSIHIQQKEDGSNGKFILYENDTEAGTLTYVRSGDHQLNIEDTEVKKAFGGKGYGKKLVQKVVEFARAHRIKVVVHCPFAKSVIHKNKDLRDVLA